MTTITRIWLAVFPLLPAASARAESTKAVEAIGITVSDLDEAAAFYCDVLSFEKVSEIELSGEAFERLTGLFGARARLARLRLGEEIIELTEYLTPRGRPVPPDSRSFDHWFQHIAIVVRDMDQAYRRLGAYKVRHVSTGPQRLPDWNSSAGGIEAFYFQDPDGHVLEIIRFPPGKGDPKWQQPTDKLFLGIDHTAIVVSDTDASLRFYRDALGLRLVGESENYGPEQERLNQVFGARLRITALRGTSGPGVEFLEYLTPPGGRPYPADARPNDLIHWRTIVSTSDPAATPQSGSGDGLPGPGVGSGVLVRDPSGHAVHVLPR